MAVHSSAHTARIIVFDISCMNIGIVIFIHIVICDINTYSHGGLNGYFQSIENSHLRR